MSTVNIRLYDIFRHELHLPEIKARELVETIQEAVKEDITASKDEYKSMWKEDFAALDKKIDSEVQKLEVKLTKTIYLTGLIQFLAIVASVVTIVGIMIRYAIK